MSLRPTYRRLELPVEFPFTISRGTQTHADVVVVEIEDDDGIVGVGGAGPARHYGETGDTVEAVLPALFEVVEAVDDPHNLDRIEREMAASIRRNPAARCAVSIALHDLVTKRLGVSLYQYWGLAPEEAVASSYTIGIDDLDTVREKTETALDRGFENLKVKLGTDDDEAVVRTVREAAPSAAIYVDANEAWSPTEAVETIHAIAAHDIEFVEQPVPAEQPAGLAYVHDRVDVQIAADESLITVDDVPRIADRCDIANLKLMKCGGLREAVRIVHAARAHGLRVMCGCMLESNASIAAACHLAPMLDYADLDGSLLLAEDAYDGVPMPGGRIDLEAVAGPGTGATPRRAD